MLLRVARAIEDLPTDGVRRVAVDGVDGAGKTTFADELGDLLTQRGTYVVRASIDGFHRPRAERWVRGRHSPEGYYLDSYDYPRVRAELLDPLGPGGDRRIRRAVHDVATDQPVASAVETVPRAACCSSTGSSCTDRSSERSGTCPCSWRCRPRSALHRCAARDGTSPAPEANRRYVEGQRIYLKRAGHASVATLVIDNTDLAAPDILDPDEGRYATRE